MQHKNVSLLLSFSMSLYQHALEDSITYCQHRNVSSRWCFMLILTPSYAQYPFSAALPKLHT